MSQKLQPVRGTQDLLPETSEIFRAIDQVARQVAQCFGYQEIATPILEFTEVFHRTLGETSDAVSKETYTFLDRGGDSLTLRPEGTAGIARAFVSEGLAQHLPLKLYYYGPMFRYERPQKGRYRQFHQIGVECLGLDTPDSDVECLSLAYLLLKKLGLESKVKLEINTLGDTESRQKHRDQLVQYLEKYKQDLSEESRVRLEKNPLRILDSKSPQDQKILEGSPALKNYLNQESKKYFEEVLSGLENLKIPYQHNERLVRGFDYYTHSVFEFTTEHLGAQSAVLAGGRYNGLVEMMGGPPTPGVGWASGVERLALLVEKQKLVTPQPLICILPADAEANSLCANLAFELRNRGQRIEVLREGQFGKRMKKADKMLADKVYIIGNAELNSNSVTIKDLKSGNQTTEKMDSILN